MKLPWERIAIFALGVAIIAALVVLAIEFPNPSSFQYTVFRIVLALGGSGIGAIVPGLLIATIHEYVRAGGAMAMFAIIYFFNPVELVVVPPPPMLPVPILKELA